MKQNMGIGFRLVALKLSVIMLLNLTFPTIAMALTSGPSQPEVQGFTPIGTSEMVDVFTGDFNYNIPLLDVDGYPINLSYRSGVGMEDEASWVGLGWSLNVGCVNRQLRGLPDDFQGDEVKKEINIKPSKTFGLSGGLNGLEIFGGNLQDLMSLSFSLGVTFNNYNGFGFQKSINASLNAAKAGKGPFTAGLGLTSDTNEGLSIQPSASLVSKASKNKIIQNLPGLSIGTSFNTRSGLKQLSVDVSITRLGLLNEMFSSKPFDLGTPTYYPSASENMKTNSNSGRFTMGLAAYGAHPNAFVNAYFTTQTLASKYLSNPAYGYMYSGYGQNDANSLLDFNREKDVPFTTTMEVLPVTNNTFDIFSISGQGIGGSYRAFRGDVGNVFDAVHKSTSTSESVGIEIGTGATSHGGYNDQTITSNSRTGPWTNENQARAAFSSTIAEANSLHEDFYFKESSDRSTFSEPEWLNKLGGFSASRIYFDVKGDFEIELDNKLVNSGNPNPVEIETTKREKRENRNDLMSMLTYSQVASGYGIYGYQYTNLGISSAAKPHHIAQITSLGGDGSRYVYANPLYNTLQKDVTFAVGQGDGDGYRPECNSQNLVEYSSNDASLNNTKGQDNYYNANITPAYAHSYLLTAYLSADYVDSDFNPGPTDGDIGNYTLFTYSNPSEYKWRAPVANENNMANFSDGVRIDPTDDKASYIYGEKEVRYLEKIETKNYIAIFQTAPRDDARGVSNEHGGVGAYSQKLVAIRLYAKSGGVQGKLLKTVHFEYEGSTSHQLCVGVPNNTEGGGKLTLKSVYFTFENSNKGRLSPYVFTYGYNAKYNRMAMDRWGNYKEISDCSNNSNPILTNRSDDFPYVRQDDPDLDIYAAAWHLNKIKLPSGGEIEVEFESDDYAYVQDKPAMQMYRIIGVYDEDNLDLDDDPQIDIPQGDEPVTIQDDDSFIIELPEDIADNINDASSLLKGINQVIYLRMMMHIKPGGVQWPTMNDPGSFEPIPVYANLADLNIEQIDSDNNGSLDMNVGLLKLNAVNIADNGINMVNPVIKSAIQYGRLNAPNIVWAENGNLPDISTASGLSQSFVNELASFIFATNLLELFQNANTQLLNRGLGKKFMPKQSFVRLSNSNGHKKGGGVRVKKITISDNWNDQSGNSGMSKKYGQVYSYNLEDGTSSGVASYEPMLGADENPFRMPIEYEINNVLAPDETRFIETPIGESFFPSPSVGYSRVTVKDFLPDDVEDYGSNAHGTGFVVQEFFTAKDFPTRVEKTALVPKPQKSNPFSIASLLNLDSKDYLSTSQGFAIELNDMHGKQKRQSVYKEDSQVPISSVEYKYSQVGSEGRLNNEVKVINLKGEIEMAQVGVHFDMITDMRESKTVVTGDGQQTNFETFVFPFPPFPVVVPIPIPIISKETTMYRSAVVTKLIQKFGLVTEVIAKDNLSVIKTKNLAYDAITGEVLVTETQNNFDDPVYSMTFPAHWYYDGMGPAFQNIGFKKSAVTFNNGESDDFPNANLYFVPGDEISFNSSTTGNQRAWVTDVIGTNIFAIRDNGTLVNGTGDVQIIRSGRRNMSSSPISQITLLTNPLQQLNSNLFEKVIQASAIEYSDNSGTYCECFSKDRLNLTTINPYFTGVKGTWRPIKNYTYLTDREQSYRNYNTNIRKDGTYQNFKPFYELIESNWKINKENWTWASEVSKYSPFGQELENIDALGRYSAARFSYNHTLPIAVAANSNHASIGFNNFEEENLSCGSSLSFNKAWRSAERSHTGRNSFKVQPDSVAKYIHISEDDCFDDSQKLNLTWPTTTTISIAGGSGMYNVACTNYNGNVTITGVSGNVINLSISSTYWSRITVQDSNGKSGYIIIKNY